MVSCVVIIIVILIAGTWSKSSSPDSNSYDSGSADCNFYDDGWQIQTMGNSGQFKYYSSCDNNEYITMKMETLTELTTDGDETNNKINSFAGNRWREDTMVGSIYYVGDTAYEVAENEYYGSEITDHPDGTDIYFNLTVMIFNEDAYSFDVENEYNLTIQEGVLKWNLQFTSWPFEDESNYLQLCIRLLIGGNAGQTNITDYNVNNEDDYFVYHFNNHMKMHLPTLYQCGNTINNVYSTVNEATNGNNIQICLQFENCNENGYIKYDPFTYFGSAVHENHAHNPIFPDTTETESTPIIVTVNEGSAGYIVKEYDFLRDWDLYSLLVGIAIGVIGACLICFIVIMFKNCCSKKENKQDKKQSGNRKTSTKTKKNPKKSKKTKDKKDKKGFFSKVSSNDIESD